MACNLSVSKKTGGAVARHRARQYLPVGDRLAAVSNDSGIHREIDCRSSHGALNSFFVESSAILASIHPYQNTA